MTRREILGQVMVFVLTIASITGSVLVLNAKRGGGRHLMPLIDGAYAGGLIAAAAALAFVVAAVVLRSFTVVGTQAVVSVILVLLHAFSLFSIQGRLTGGEASDGSVGWGQLGYAVAVAVQIVAAVIGFSRMRALSRAGAQEDNCEAGGADHG
jgi:hypothetical protein